MSSYRCIMHFETELLHTRCKYLQLLQDWRSYGSDLESLVQVVLSSTKVYSTGNSMATKHRV